MHRAQKCRLYKVIAQWLLLLFAATTMVVVTITPVALANDANDDAASLGPGCAPERPAVAHHAGGIRVAVGGPASAPIPCSTSTGFRTGEVSIAIANDGTILFQPALDTETTGFPVGLLRSSDRGETWTFVNPAGVPARSQGDDMNMWVDQQTGRVFWVTTLAPPFANDTPRADHSDDGGITWFPSSLLPTPYDHTQVFTGPPTEALQGLQEDYPSVVYVCVSGGATCSAHNFCGTHCTRSVNGGTTFGPAMALPYPPECPSPGVFPTGGYGLHGVVAPDGTVYLPFTPCERPYVAVSHDEGATWQLVLVADVETIGWGELSLGMDEAGSLYAAWVRSSDRPLYLSVSSDHALHWSAPMMIAAPSVNEAAEPQLVAGVKGQVAVTYYGSTNAPSPSFPPTCAGGASVDCPGYQHETWNTYVTETWNGLSRKPLFWSATLNDPSEPTWFGLTPSSMRIPGGFAGGSSASAGFVGPSLSGRMDYFAAAMAPDNTPLVGFVQQCPFGLPVPGNPNCPSTLTGTGPDGLFGMVGRLVRVREEDQEGDNH
jgi:hypothetical protein